MRTIVFVDGFNFYYRKLKQRPQYRWINLKTLSELCLSRNNQVVQVQYFTARVSSSVSLTAPRDQKIYLNALASVPEIAIKEGSFLKTNNFMPLVQPPEFRPETTIVQPWPIVVKVTKMEEKGSDVNLASHLLLSAFKNEFDVAAVITNDIDLVEPIRIVREELGKTVGLITPVRNPHIALTEVSDFVRRIRDDHLAKAQFPDVITLNDGSTIQRPEGWVKGA